MEPTLAISVALLILAVLIFLLDSVSVVIDVVKFTRPAPVCIHPPAAVEAPATHQPANGVGDSLAQVDYTLRYFIPALEYIHEHSDPPDEEVHNSKELIMRRTMA